MHMSNEEREDLLSHSLFSIEIRHADAEARDSLTEPALNTSLVRVAFLSSPTDEGFMHLLGIIHCQSYSLGLNVVHPKSEI